MTKQRARAALITDIGEPFVIADVHVDEPIGTEVLVDVRASGLCHSDYAYTQRDVGFDLPLLLGHEIAGVVRRVGPEVREVVPGDHVVACLVVACGRCVPCREGKPTSCVASGIARRSVDAPPRVTHDGAPVSQFNGIGGFTDLALVDERQLVAVDDRVPFDRAAVLGCGVVTGAGAVLRSAMVSPFDTVAVIGVGGVGLNAVQAARHVGARKIIAVDLRADKLALAERFGATHLVDASACDPVEAVREITSGVGVDHVFEISGHSAPLHQGVGMLASRGTVYLVGLQRPGTTFEHSLAARESTWMSAQHGIRGVMMGSTNFKVDVPYFAELYLQGRLNLDDLVARKITLDEINAGYADLESGAGVARSVITF